VRKGSVDDEYPFDNEVALHPLLHTSFLSSFSSFFSKKGPRQKRKKDEKEGQRDIRSRGYFRLN